MRTLPRLLLSLVLAALLPACGSEPPSVEEYLGLVPQAVRVAEEDARAAAPRGSATGPLLVDVQSFAAGSHRATGEIIPPATVQEVLQRTLEQPFRPTPRDSSFNCMELELGHSCWVPFNGVYVRLNVASRVQGRITLHVSTSVTASNYIPPVLCDRILRMKFVQEDGRWVLREKEPTRTC